MDSSYVSQTVPLGPTPYGTALYQPSLSSLTKYQYKTPSLPATTANPTSQYRTLSGVLSNNLKKNWAAGAAPPVERPQRKVDQVEIDARLKSLMDRLSSQQSLLKPADKPSEQMQHYIDQVGQTTQSTKCLIYLLFSEQQADTRAQTFQHEGIFQTLQTDGATFSRLH